MADFPYTTVLNKLKTFLKKIQDIGIPDIVDKKLLASSGFSGSNDSTIIPVLKFIGFIDDNGKPTSRWTQYRDKARAGKVIAEAINEAYSELFTLYPDANNRSTDELKNFFSTKTTAGSRAVSQTVSTFKSLCENADFSEVPSKITEKPEIISTKKEEINIAKIKKEISGFETGITININIQLTLPETTDETVYNKFFEALKKHLLT